MGSLSSDVGCIGQTHEKKYYELENVFVKRSLTEWPKNKAGRFKAPYICDKRLGK